jgi:hypothetical protein
MVVFISVRTTGRKRARERVIRRLGEVAVVFVADSRPSTDSNGWTG